MDLYVLRICVSMISIYIDDLNSWKEVALEGLLKLGQG